MLNPELKALLSISKIGPQKDLKQVLNKILKIVGNTMKAHSGSIMLLNKETNELEMVATFGLPDDYIQRIYDKGVPITTSPSGVVLRTGHYYLVPNVFKEPKDKPWLDLARELGFSAQIFMPMKQKKEIIGLLNIYMTNPRKFKESEIAFLTIAASQAAAVIENTRLYIKIFKKKLELKQEVNEHKETEKALQKNQKVLNNILSSSPIGIGLVVDRKLSWANESMIRIFGVKRKEDYIGRNAGILYASEKEYKRVGEIIYKNLKDKVIQTDAKFKRKDGSLFEGHIMISFLDSSNPIKGAVATISDISWRKQTERALRKSKEKFRKLAEKVPVAIFIYKGAKIYYANPAAEAITGYKQKELLTMNFWDFIHPDFQDLVRKRGFARQQGQKVPSRYEVKILTKSGEEHWLDFGASTTEFEGELAVLGVCRDITERKRIDQSKDEFISIASHQLRTPLTIMDCYSQMLLSKDKYKLNDKQEKEYLEEIYNANQRLTELVKALLNVSRIDLGTFLIELKPTKIKKVADGILKEFLPEIKNKKLKIEKNYDRNIPIIRADQKLIQMVFQNLLSNAIKYTPEKGKISLIIKKQKPNLLIKVSDTGYGISKNQQSKIFTKFFRADNIKIKEADGTGLGLYIVKAAIEEMGGKIWFESEKGKGTTFYITLPLKRTKRAKDRRIFH